MFHLGKQDELDLCKIFENELPILRFIWTLIKCYIFCYIIFHSFSLPDDILTNMIIGCKLTFLTKILLILLKFRCLYFSVTVTKKVDFKSLLREAQFVKMFRLLIKFQ